MDDAPGHVEGLINDGVAADDDAPSRLNSHRVSRGPDTQVSASHASGSA